MSRQAIVLAAGAGRRFGGGKLLADWRGAPLVCAAVKAALATDVEGVIVVTGAQADDVRQALSTLRDPRLFTVLAPDWNDGLSASLKAGIRALPQDAAACAIFLGDMPLASAGLADLLLDQVEAGAPAACPAHPAGPAHPIAFGRAAFPAILALTGDVGARAVLLALGEAVAVTPITDDGALFDVDRPEDLDGRVEPGS